MTLGEIVLNRRRCVKVDKEGTTSHGAASPLAGCVGMWYCQRPWQGGEADEFPGLLLRNLN